MNKFKLKSSNQGSVQLRPVASTSERKLSIELPSSRQIYTTGSTVTGIVHLGSKDHERIQEIQVSLVCTVRSMHHRYLGGYAHDVRREVVQLIHDDKTLWTSQNGEAGCPPADLAFEMVIPEVGNDRRAHDPNTPLPPSFHAGKHRGWRNFFTYGTPIGFIKYHVKASVVRKKQFKGKERAFCPFVFLPPSAPPPLLPTPPETISDHGVNLLGDLWQKDSGSVSLRHGVFNASGGQASLTLWMPRVPSFPRLISIPFVLCLALQTQQVKYAYAGQPPEDVLPPTPQLDKASLFLRQRIRSCARGGVQYHTRTLDGEPTDNMLHGITPQEGAWTAKIYAQMGYWEKGFMWRGLWTFRDVPNFQNRQLAWGYELVAEVPIHGLGNSIKLFSQPIEVSSGVTEGRNLPQTSEDVLDLPPDYFEADGTMNDDDGNESPGDEKA